MTLSDDLQDIDGIGPATAAKILDVLDAHAGADVDPEAVADAIDQARRGNEGEVIAFLETLR